LTVNSTVFRRLFRNVGLRFTSFTVSRIAFTSSRSIALDHGVPGVSLLALSAMSAFQIPAFPLDCPP
jgi:hypothetical protein